MGEIDKNVKGFMKMLRFNLLAVGVNRGCKINFTTLGNKGRRRKKERKNSVSSSHYILPAMPKGSIFTSSSSGGPTSYEINPNS